jgi:hypothetical protein
MIAGQQALPPEKFDRLLDILGFQARHEYYEPSKPCILIAEMGKHAREAYLALTRWRLGAFHRGRAGSRCS